MKANKAVWVARLVALGVGVYLLTTSHKVFGEGLITGVIILPILDYLFSAKK